MRIELGNVDARLLAATAEERAFVREYLTYDDPQARFANVDRFVELLGVDDTFPAGLVGKLRAAAKAHTPPFPVDIEDPRPEPCDLRIAFKVDWLRDYQRRAFEACLKRGRGIVRIPTGGGKTEVMAALAFNLVGEWLIVVPQADLLYQTADRIEQRTGERPGILGDGVIDVRRVTVATFQTLHKKLTKDRDPVVRDLVDRVTGLMVDECHTLPAGSLYHVARACRSAHRRIGFSGTPLERGDKKSLFVIAMLGSVIVDITAQELIARGVLARPKVKMLRVVQGSTAPTWQGVYGECVVRSKKRNAAVVAASVRARKPALVFVSQVQHGKKLLPELQRAGLRASLVWGEHGTDARKRHLTSLERGDLDVIVCSTVFQTGIDFPGLEAVVIGGGGASVIAALQKLGRGTRKVEGKDTFEVWDILDDGHRWLRRHSGERRDAYEREGHEVVVEDAGLGDDDVRRDEDGHVVGSPEQAKARTAQRHEASRDLIGTPTLSNPNRGRNGPAPEDVDVDW